MEIYKKIAKAKEEIKTSKIKKTGRNDFSKYNYFTPEQVENLVFIACKNNDLLTKFDLKRNEFGETAYLTIINIENVEEFVIYEMATAIPSITATNIAQQLGGCVTYSERYLKMSAFGITENALDFDSKNNSKKTIVKTPKIELLPDTEIWNKAVKFLQDGGTILEIENKYKISETDKEILMDLAI